MNVENGTDNLRPDLKKNSVQPSQFFQVERACCGGPVCTFYCVITKQQPHSSLNSTATIREKKCLKSFVRSCTQHLRLAGHRTCHYKFLVKCRQCDIRSDQSATNPVFYRRTAAFLSLITQQITKAIVANKEN